MRRPINIREIEIAQNNIVSRCEEKPFDPRESLSEVFSLVGESAGWGAVKESLAKPSAFGLGEPRPDGLDKCVRSPISRDVGASRLGLASLRDL